MLQIAVDDSDDLGTRVIVNLQIVAQVPSAEPLGPFPAQVLLAVLVRLEVLFQRDAQIQQLDALLLEALTFHQHKEPDLITGVAN